MESFLKQFNFQPDRKLMIGLERESFVTDLDGQIVPWAAKVLAHLPLAENFGYELSACQVEARIGPSHLDDLPAAILAKEKIMNQAQDSLGFRLSFTEIAPENMPLEVYPDPTGRYQKITAGMPKKVLLSACRIISTHIHVGMPDHQTALKVYNQVIKNSDKLASISTSTNGQRLKIYRTVAPNFQPVNYTDWQQFYEYAKQHDFANNPRNCWHLIRISVHGTIEFRMFGATADTSKIISWANQCHKLCQNAL